MQIKPLEFTDTIAIEAKGQTRIIDENGRFVLPQDYRILYGIDGRTSVEIIGTNVGVLIRRAKEEKTK